jgi:hypothetical protein
METIHSSFLETIGTINESTDSIDSQRSIVLKQSKDRNNSLSLRHSLSSVVSGALLSIFQNWDEIKLPVSLEKHHHSGSLPRKMSKVRHSFDMSFLDQMKKLLVDFNEIQGNSRNISLLLSLSIKKDIVSR